MEIAQNATEPLLFLLVSSTDHVTGQTGKAPTVYLSKAGAAGAVPAGAVAEVDATNFPGLYKLTPTTVDTGTLGALAMHVTAAGCDPVDREYHIVLSGLDRAFGGFGAGTLGKRIADNLDATVSTRSTHTAADVATAVLVTPANKLATDGTGQVTVGTMSAAALTSFRTKLEENGSALANLLLRLTQPISDKLGLLAVNGAGAVTTSNPSSGSGGPTASDIVTALKSDTQWKQILSHAHGKFTATYPGSLPGNATIACYAEDGTTVLYNVTLALDASGRPVTRTVA